MLFGKLSESFNGNGLEKFQGAAGCFEGFHLIGRPGCCIGCHKSEMALQHLADIHFFFAVKEGSPMEDARYFASAMAFLSFAPSMICPVLSAAEQDNASRLPEVRLFSRLASSRQDGLWLQQSPPNTHKSHPGVIWHSPQ